VFGHSGHQCLHDPGIDVEQVVSGHAGLPGDASGDDDQLRPLECALELLLAGEGGHLLCEGALLMGALRVLSCCFECADSLTP